MDAWYDSDGAGVFPWPGRRRQRPSRTRVAGERPGAAQRGIPNAPLRARASDCAARRPDGRVRAGRPSAAGRPAGRGEGGDPPTPRGDRHRRGADVKARKRVPGTGGRPGSRVRASFRGRPGDCRPGADRPLAEGLTLTNTQATSVYRFKQDGHTLAGELTGQSPCSAQEALAAPPPAPHGAPRHTTEAKHAQRIAQARRARLGPAPAPYRGGADPAAGSRHQPSHLGVARAPPGTPRRLDRLANHAGITPVPRPPPPPARPNRQPAFRGRVEHTPATRTPAHAEPLTVRTAAASSYATRQKSSHAARR